MNNFRWVICFFLVILAACNPLARSVNIYDNDHLYSFSSNEQIPIELLASQGLVLGPDDRILYQDAVIMPDTQLPDSNDYTLIIRRAVVVTLITPESTRRIPSSASTVQELLFENNIPLFPADSISPPPDTTLISGLIITWKPAIALTIDVDGDRLTFFSSAATVGQALTDGGIPLVGLDFSIPVETAPIPRDGHLQVIRVNENVLLTQTSIPFSTHTELSADLELDQQEVIQAGIPGVAVSRIRTRTENGIETDRQIEGENIIRQAQNKVVGIGTRVVIRTAIVDGVTISYWRAVVVYATSYSPCRSGVTSCLSGTSSGLPVQKGVVAVASRWYPYIVGYGVYIPGYGHATVADIGGGFPDRFWVDLAYSDDDFIAWGDWVTLYFLTPVPPTIQYELPYR